MPQQNRRIRLWFLLVCCSLLSFFTSLTTGCNCEDSGVNNSPPKILVTPSTLVFEAIPVGEYTNKPLAIKNVGLQDLTITELKIVNEQAEVSFLLLTTKEMPLKIAVNEEIKLTVRYAPKRAGSARGHLRIISDAENSETGGLTKVPLRSTQLNADISAIPNPMDFGVVKPDEEKVQTLTIKNQGQADLQIDALDFKSNAANEFKIKTPLSFPKTLPPGKDVTVDIAFTPTKNTSDEILIIRNNTPEATNYEVRLIGQRAAPDIEVTPTVLNFDDVKIGEKKSKSFTIKNKGTVPLLVSALQFDATTSKDFDMPTLPTLPLQIEPGKTVDIEVSYHSRDVDNDKGAIKIQNNDPDTPEVTVLLEAKATGCDLEATPSQLYFTRPDKMKVNVVNKGNLPCTYKNAKFSPTTSQEFSFFKPPPSASSVPPGGFLEFEISFTPRDNTDDQGELLIESSDPDSPQLVVKLESKLSAAQACQIKVVPTSVQFGFVGNGRSKQQSVSVSNEGYGDCNISNATIDPNPSNAFILRTQVPTNGLLIPSNGKIDITVAFTPPKDGTYTGDLKLKSNDTTNPEVTVKLNGTAGQLCLEALPDPLDFGSVKENCSSQREKMEIFNICNQSAQITGIQFGATTNKPKEEFYIKQAPTMPQTLAFGQSVSLLLSYAPKDLGVDIGTLEIANSLPNQSPITVTLRGEGVDTDTQKDTFQQLKQPQIDILFVIDDSCSMGDDQNNLANNTNSFIQWAAQLQVDYQIGVTTTDTGKKGCLRGATKIVTPNTPNLVAEFQTNAKAGTAGSGLERGLEASYMALTNPSLTGCNNGFYRPNASLSLVYVSDEPDQSPQPVAFYINFFKNLKGFRNPDKIRASAIGYQAASACQTGTSCRYYAVSQALRGIYDRISSTNWGQTLSQLGAVTFGYRTQFFLSRPADATTITVKVNGQTVTEDPSTGWSYDQSSNSINFSKSVVPTAGAIVEVTYRAVCLPP